MTNSDVTEGDTVEAVQEDDLVHAYVLDGEGGATALDWDGVRAWTPDQGPLWVHLNRKGAEAPGWIEAESGLDPVVADALLAQETRPHCEAVGEGALLILRGININPGADPSDMVSIRIWAEADRMITTRRRKLSAINTLTKSLGEKRGPKTVADLISDLASALVERVDPVVEGIDREIDTLEVSTGTSEPAQHRARLQRIRRKVISLRRYIAPQRVALGHLIEHRLPWLDQGERLRLREMADRITRYVEELETARERTLLVQDELSSRLSEQMNRAMYVLTIVATVFLPLGFVTGLLGVNLGGIPGTDEPMAFAALCFALLGFALLELWLFRRMKWI